MRSHFELLGSCAAVALQPHTRLRLVYLVLQSRATIACYRHALLLRATITRRYNLCYNPCYNDVLLSLRAIVTRCNPELQSRATMA
jgi:hypothetical protein